LPAVPDQALGIGILTTAEKKGKLRNADIGLARDWMCTLNKPGSRFGKLDGVTAMTDVTGFGLLGHLVEMADGSQLTALIEYDRVPRLPGVEYYLEQGCIPGGTLRNYDSYASKLGRLQALHKNVLCDPQTSGGLLIAVTPEGNDTFLAPLAQMGLNLAPIGELVERQSHAVEVS
jgi:selenide,water dikinase